MTAQTIAFVKMQAQGNDFVIIDNRKQAVPIINAERARALAERRYGIGCDQVLVLQAVNNVHVDARMLIFNSDGTEAENCGNGLRCVSWWLAQHKQQDIIYIALQDRVIQAKCDFKSVAVHMGVAKIIANTNSHTDVCMGNKHRVMFMTKNEHIDPNINTEIISGQIGNDIYIDIIECGAGHTPACGSGACAVAAAVWQRQSKDGGNMLNIHMPGGVVQVQRNANNELILSGDVHIIFAGQFIYSGKIWENR